ncbi:MAG: helix-turn-helix transcriptional regulator [Lachnospiraceae bacterium]|nr:helix-turn-helix transcriptional regulator [Candidatus Darwinimomas equi]
MPLPPKILLHDAVATRIRELTEEKGYSVDVLSSVSGVPKSTITDYLRGASKDIKLSTVAKIANGFDMTVLDFFVDDRFDLIDIEELFR